MRSGCAGGQLRRGRDFDLNQRHGLMANAGSRVDLSGRWKGSLFHRVCDAARWFAVTYLFFNELRRASRFRSFTGYVKPPRVERQV
jgi:hypothetical protein